MNKNHTRDYIQLFSVFAFTILLTACAVVPELPWLEGEEIDAAWLEKSDRFEKILGWSVTGRIGINAEEEAWNANIHWLQQEDRYRIRFNAPLALGAAEIRGRPGDVAIRTMDRRIFRATDPESLVEKVIGWRIPISGLHYWLLGRPDVDAPIDKLKLDAEGRLRRLEQSGWRIRYLSYRSVDGFELPDSIELENDRLSARFIVINWALSFRPEGIAHPPPSTDTAHEGAETPESATPGNAQESPSVTDTIPDEPDMWEPERGDSDPPKKGGIRSLPILGDIFGGIFTEDKGE